MSTCKSFVALVLFLLSSHYSFAEVKLPALFSDHMVLQHDMDIPVWGWADPGEKVIVKIGGFVAETIANAEGRWKVQTGPLKAGGPYEMVISGANTIKIANVLAGEVWVCSGQSNMAMEVRSCMNAEEVISLANFPEIRHFQVKRAKASHPMEDVLSTSDPSTSWLNSWEICDPSTVGHFSGSAYFFALDLYKKRNIPVGIIHASWGGTTAEAWTPRDTLISDRELKDILEDWPDYNNDEEWLTQEYEKFVQEVEKARLEGRDDPLYFNQPSVLYNGIIAPIIPFGIRGVLWYQGESNAYRATQYRDLFPAMITQWRKKWTQGDFPFLFVQLANYQFEPQVFPELREAQTMALSLPQTAMAVTIDIGDSADIHPRNKQEVGRRLSLAAQKIAYGEDIVFSGPLFKKMFIDDSKCWLLFNHVGDGMIAKGDGELRGFTISGSDGLFVEAQARIDGDQVIVWNESIEQPVAVRYAWANHPVGCNLYNMSGDKPHLPASPFRTDNWPGITSNREFGSKTSSIKESQENSELLVHAIVDKLQSMEPYSYRDNIVNGTKWTYRKIYRGNPFIAEDYWPNADLLYRGIRYTDFQINYDLYQDDLILLYTDNNSKKYIVLSKEYLESFSYTDTVHNQEHFYEYFRISGTTGKELYEKVYDGRTSFIIRPGCEISNDPSGSFPGEYVRSYEYYIQVEGNYIRIHSKKTLVNALNRNIPEVKKFIRKNRLKIDSKHPENIVPVLRYFDEIS